jgi:serine-type D-Ala-D-Ala carboxypeptidase/endopeptidase (penicillin-binding protein 4)
VAREGSHRDPAGQAEPTEIQEDRQSASSPVAVRAETPPAAQQRRLRLRRGPVIVLLATLLVLSLVISGFLVLRPGPVDRWLGAPAATPSWRPAPAEVSPPPVLTEVAANAPMPTPDGVRAAIDALVKDSALGDRVRVSVLDVVTGTELYDKDGAAATVPASTTKLVTAAAVLATRGAAYRIPTRAVAGQTPGEVVLVGGGDPTLAAGEKGAYPGAARLDQLAEQVKQALGDTPVTKVTVDSSLYTGPAYGPGWDDDIQAIGCSGPITALMVDSGYVDPKKTGCSPRHTQPHLVAGRAFAKALGAPPEVVKKVGEGTAPGSPAQTGNSLAASPETAGSGNPVPGAELGRVESPPVIRLVEFMLEDSDNVVAEALARQVALARGKPASFAGVAAAMDVVLAELGLDAGQCDLFDGSGLSRNNRIAPQLLTDLLVLAADGSRPELSALFAGLPVAGWSGTLVNRYVSPNTAGLGVVRAKTGTLTGVHSLSGVVTTAEGRLLAFAIMADGLPRKVGSWEAQPALDRIAAELAACGCR